MASFDTPLTQIKDQKSARDIIDTISNKEDLTKIADQILITKDFLTKDEYESIKDKSQIYRLAHLCRAKSAIQDDDECDMDDLAKAIDGFHIGLNSEAGGGLQKGGVEETISDKFKSLGSTVKNFKTSIINNSSGIDIQNIIGSIDNKIKDMTGCLKEVASSLIGSQITDADVMNSLYTITTTTGTVALGTHYQYLLRVLFTLGSYSISAIPTLLKLYTAYFIQYYVREETDVKSILKKLVNLAHRFGKTPEDLKLYIDTIFKDLKNKIKNKADKVVDEERLIEFKAAIKEGLDKSRAELEKKQENVKEQGKQQKYPSAYPQPDVDAKDPSKIIPLNQEEIQEFLSLTDDKEIQEELTKHIPEQPQSKPKSQLKKKRSIHHIDPNYISNNKKSKPENPKEEPNEEPNEETDPYPAGFGGGKRKSRKAKKQSKKQKKHSKNKSKKEKKNKTKKTHGKKH